MSGFGSRVSAASKPGGNQLFTILKISWKSKPDPNMEMPLYFKKSIQKGFHLRLSRG